MADYEGDAPSITLRTCALQSFQNWRTGFKILEKQSFTLFLLRIDQQ